jgi:hypothetical protein
VFCLLFNGGYMQGARRKVIPGLSLQKRIQQEEDFHLQIML